MLLDGGERGELPVLNEDMDDGYSSWQSLVRLGEDGKKGSSFPTLLLQKPGVGRAARKETYEPVQPMQ